MGATHPPVRWGILSTAKIATKVCRAMDAASSAKPVAVASRNYEKARDWALHHGIEKSHGSYEALLDDPDVDAVYIGLPPSMHHEWTIKALEHGKHVLCEKPFALSLSQAGEMAGAAECYGKNLMDGVMWVHHARTPEMRAKLAPEVLGEIKRATVAFCFRWDEVPDGNIRVRPELGGGCLGDLGWYCVRAIWWALGETPDRVFATARYVNHVTYNLSAMLWFPSGKMASFDCGFDVNMRQWIEVAGTKRSLVCDDFVLPRSTTESKYYLHDGDTGASEKFTTSNCVQEVRMIEHFSQHVLSGTLNRHWLAEALITQRICDAIERAARAEQIVHL